MLQYDYDFEVAEDSILDAVTISVGATHPLLNGRTKITTILDSISAFGSIAAREDSVWEPIERRQKRNILRRLPATNFTVQIHNIFIPPESNSYADDGLSLFLPKIEEGRMMVRFDGGMEIADAVSDGSNTRAAEVGSDGIKLVANFEIPLLVLNIHTSVKDFPELDIRESDKLHTLLSGMINGSVEAHLRPQTVKAPHSKISPNSFSPLDAYEIDFAPSSLLVKMKEFSSTLGHRRITFPPESTFSKASLIWA